MIVHKNYVEDERLFSTGNSKLDDILTEVYYSGISDGYEYAQKEFGKKKAKKEDKVGAAAGGGVLGAIGAHAYIRKKHSDRKINERSTTETLLDAIDKGGEQDRIHEEAISEYKKAHIERLEEEAKLRKQRPTGLSKEALDVFDEKTKSILDKKYEQRLREIGENTDRKLEELNEIYNKKTPDRIGKKYKGLKKNKKVFRNKLLIGAAAAVPVGLAVREAAKKKNSKKEKSDQREFAKKEKKSESSGLVKTGVGVAGTAGLGGAVLLGTSKIARSQADKYAEESKAAEKGAKEIRKRLDMMKNLSNEMGATLKGEEEAEKSIKHLIKKSEAQKKISEEFMKDSKAMKRLGRGSLGLAAVGAGVAATAGIRKIAKK